MTQAGGALHFGMPWPFLRQLKHTFSFLANSSLSFTDNLQNLKHFSTRWPLAQKRQPSTPWLVEVWEGVQLLTSFYTSLLRVRLTGICWHGGNFRLGSSRCPWKWAFLLIFRKFRLGGKLSLPLRSDFWISMSFKMFYTLNQDSSLLDLAPSHFHKFWQPLSSIQ